MVIINNKQCFNEEQTLLRNNKLEIQVEIYYNQYSMHIKKNLRKLFMGLLNRADK